MPREDDMHDSKLNEVIDFIDQYLTEQDKMFICSKSSSSTLRSFPGNETFQLYSEATNVKQFCEYGHHISVMGFGVDFILEGCFGDDWIEIQETDRFQTAVIEKLIEKEDDGYVFDDEQLDQIWAWITLSPYQLMSITQPVRSQLCKIVDVCWDICVMKGKSYERQSKELACQMMKDIISHWCSNILITQKGVGKRNLIDMQ